ncbi:RNA polymerase sigma-H factor [Bacteroides pyogenes]|uniref:RNA polymerase sigma-70 factor n=1 Tax=Bacteroides pyogenes TaxID=310300 RepID=UPI0011E3C683|nr:RNA polymerase sigma-70 factor [Bacteroides pyogenes]MBR8705633.1 RNA polymerase sigma-H factor [Bacteroides pyogenes]MBR8719632.1 RNA polymerase sigma-H factor [Bacteroides pyogenes]MBR8786527.1 RNA polymerase sigma-H factor [Bacteroides pyogenes]MBR8792010.1 RNA polymerase sigma-H factor [Bacteroides pyogenes]MCE9106454.1 RNA polymerase sigma-70 factor [Bacteroides pyogenes]
MNSKQRTEDEYLILEQLSKGDSEAFRKLYLFYYDRLFRFALTFLHSEPASEDVISDIFFNLWKDRYTLPSIPNLQAYLYQAVRNGCLNVLKSGYVSKRDELPDTDLQVTVSPASPLDELAYKELTDAIAKAVVSLPERCRLIFRMAKEDGMNHKEIAEALNVKLCTVERQLLLAKAKIRKSIEPFLDPHEEE